MGLSGVTVWLTALRAQNALPTRMLLPPVPQADLSALARFERITLTPEMIDLFATVTGYNTIAVAFEAARYTGPPHVVSEMPLYPYHSPIPFHDVASHIQFWRDILAPDDEDYIGRGFVPFGQEHNGEYLFVNADAASPTYGAVYQMWEGFGSAQRAASLPAYFAGLTRMLDLGVLFIDQWGRIGVNPEDYTYHWRREVGQFKSEDGTRDW